jgi:hypothetical protein
MTESLFRISGDWALGADEVQWIIYRRHRQKDRDTWDGIKFIRSTKQHLAYRLTLLAPANDARRLLDGLPETFNDWLAARWSGDGGDDLSVDGYPPSLRERLPSVPSPASVPPVRSNAERVTAIAETP